MSVTTSKGSIQISLRGLGPVPSFKNAKRMAFNKKTGKPFPVTNKKVKAWMDAAIDSIESQLRSVSVTRDGEISTEPWRLSLIASLLPEDDSWRHIPELHLRGIKVPRGQEGCDILIEVI